MSNLPAVLSLCDRTGNMVRPWAQAGYPCFCVDIQHPEIRQDLDLPITYIGGDVRSFVPPLQQYTIVFAFPPCTHTAVSGARWFPDKGLDALIESLTIVRACRRICQASGAPWMLENPVSTIATYWRKPDHYFHPCDYAGYLDDPSPEAYTKKTCLWTGDGFIMPEPRGVLPTLGSMIHRMPPSEDRGDKRSETPHGFARAVFEANRIDRRLQEVA